MHYSAIRIMALHVERELTLSQQRLEQERLLRESDCRAGMTAHPRGEAVLDRARHLANGLLHGRGMPPARWPRRQRLRSHFVWRRARRGDQAGLSEA